MKPEVSKYGSWKPTNRHGGPGNPKHQRCASCVDTALNCFLVQCYTLKHIIWNALWTEGEHRHPNPPETKSQTPVLAECTQDNKRAEQLIVPSCVLATIHISEGRWGNTFPQASQKHTPDRTRGEHCLVISFPLADARTPAWLESALTVRRFFFFFFDGWSIDPQITASFLWRQGDIIPNNHCQTKKKKKKIPVPWKN